MSVLEHLRLGGAHGRAVLVTRHEQLSRCCVDGEVCCGPVGLRAVGPERTDRDGDECRVGGTQGSKVDADGPGLDEHVGAQGELSEGFLPRRSSEIDHDTALAAVPRDEGERAVGVRRIAGEGPECTDAAAARLLHEQHVGPEGVQHLRRNLAPVIREVQHAIGIDHHPISPGKPALETGTGWLRPHDDSPRVLLPPCRSYPFGAMRREVVTSPVLPAPNPV